MSRNSAQKKTQATTMDTSSTAERELKAEILPTSEPSLQDYPETSKHNVSKRERVASGVIGGGLLMYGIPNFLTIPGQVSNLAGVLLLTRGVTGHCPVYSRFGIDSTPNGRMHHRGISDPHPLQLRQTMSTSRSMHEVFEFCHHQEQVALCFPNVKEVQKIDERRSIWMFMDSAELISFPVTVEITQDVEGQQLSWTAMPDSRFRIHGTLQFKAGPHDQETEIITTVHMVPPAGILGSTLMKLLSPVTQEALNEILHKMKQMLETGAITTSQNHVSKEIKDPIGGWQNRVKSHLHIRTMQSLANRRIS
ncbi:MAG TPA: YgaP-like transmembrane domain [Oligoflexus sp.]|uniref:YgaP-like transmembrane domain n=1 Tax=Oligoflexus sp. TaxID=1971216 RepID=UPI002D646795|nr:YgaP-like transmembrane domain [Oligoflexus sp.]HYX31798.1 YgaP-like transmembrane domain [Oligoflexus sp.]